MFSGTNRKVVCPQT